MRPTLPWQSFLSIPNHSCIKNIFSLSLVDHRETIFAIFVPSNATTIPSTHCMDCKIAQICEWKFLPIFARACGHFYWKCGDFDEKMKIFWGFCCVCQKFFVTLCPQRRKGYIIKESCPRTPTYNLQILMHAPGVQHVQMCARKGAYPWWRVVKDFCSPRLV